MRLSFVSSRARYWTAALVLALVAGVLAGCSGSKPAAEQPKDKPAAEAPKEAWPTKPIQCIVPWAAGGSSDMSQRMVASLITPHLGTSMIVVNRPGGGSIPGTAEIGKAPPDGYTIGQVWYAAFALRPFVQETPYKTDQYEFILGMVRQRNAIAVRSDSPYKTLDDLVKAAKAKPGKLTYGSPGAASWQHMAGAHFCKVAGIEATHVPYDGGRPATLALLGGHLDFIVGQPPEFAGELEKGDIRVLAALETERIPDLPDVPTARELGYDCAHPHMMIIVAPKGTPQDRIKKIHDSYKAVIESKEFKELAKNMKLEVEYKSGEDVKKEIDQLSAIYKDLAPLLKK